MTAGRIQPLHFTSKAIEQLLSYDFPAHPFAHAATRYLVEKLMRAEVFVLPDHGELLDRSKVRPEVPGTMFRPPFPVVALEYTSTAPRRVDEFYTSVRSSKRIALAWDWEDGELPAIFGPLNPYGPGVAIASICWLDDAQMWMPMAGIIHVSHDVQWLPMDTASSAFAQAMMANGQIPKKVAASQTFECNIIPLMLESLSMARERLGTMAATIDTVHADLADEVSAYTDMCYALACRNVTYTTQAEPTLLNKQRARKGKPPLRGFHVLQIGGDDMEGGTGHGSARTGPRSHLRRGHIRRLSPDRITWVNPAMVRGRGGFVDKIYSVGGQAS